MKKVLISMVGLMAVAGCAKYDYFRGDIRYVQDGRDCIYYANEYGKNYSNDIRGLDTDKKIVYRNTMCSDLYARDHAGAAEAREDRSAMVQAPVAVAQPAPSCGCNACGNVSGDDNMMVLRRRYVIMPAM